MRDNDQILWALDHSISPHEFERLCVDLLGREGYRQIVPVGGTNDRGQDAELRYYVGAADRQVAVAFQFSLEKRWEPKLRKDAAKIANHNSDIVTMVFVTTQMVTGAKRDSLRTAIREQFGWNLTIFSREWLRARLSELHHDLAAKYLGISLPPTPGYAATAFELSIIDDAAEQEIFQHTSPELLRAMFAARTEKEPHDPRHWYQLARLEYALRNYDAAIRAVTGALRLGSADELLVLNIELFHAGVLAEKGIAERSRPLLVRARDILLKNLPGRKRAVDHYNLGNILGALGERAEAKKQYAYCLALEPQSAKAWKNFGSLFAAEGDHDVALEAFDQALSYQPDLVEAHLCKATTHLIFRNEPEEAIRCFETALSLVTSIHEKWPYVGYWFSRALCEVGRDEEALKQIESELAVRPDDVFLLDQKVVVLRQLRKRDVRYEDQAMEFLKFRVDALPFDFLGLGEIVDILQGRGQPDAAWPLIDRNLRCEPSHLSELATAAEISIAEFGHGFEATALYEQFRGKFSLEDHCMTLHGYGLSPTAALIQPLNLMLLPVFGTAARDLDPTNGPVDNDKLNATSLRMLETTARVFPLFGSMWLASSAPQDEAEKTRLLTLGMCYLADVVAAETARQIGFLRGCYRIAEQSTFTTSAPDWPEIGSQIAMRLLQCVTNDWKMGPGEDAKGAAGQETADA